MGAGFHPFFLPLVKETPWVHLGIFVRITLSCGWATSDQHGIVLFTWHQYPSFVRSMSCLSVSLLCSCNRAHLLWESQSLLSHGSPVCILIHGNGRGLQTILSTVPHEIIAGCVCYGHGQIRSFATIVALVSRGVFNFQTRSICRAERVDINDIQKIFGSSSTHTSAKCNSEAKLL